MDAHHIYRPLLDLIGRAEGTDRGRGYDETLAYGLLTGGPVRLTRMSLDEIDALQTRMLAHPRNRWNSSAVGRYQIVRATLRDLRRRLGLDGKQRFDPALQDRLACFLLGRRGIDRCLAGAIGEREFIDALAREWASLPGSGGRSAYSGQKAAVSLAEVRRVLAAVRARAGPPAFDWRRIFRWLAALLPVAGIGDRP